MRINGGATVIVTAHVEHRKTMSGGSQGLEEFSLCCDKFVSYTLYSVICIHILLLVIILDTIANQLDNYYIILYYTNYYN